MRILTVTHFYESHGGGIERVAGHLCRAFARLGQVSVWAATIADPAPAALDVVPLSAFNGIERLTGLPLPLLYPGAIRRLGTAVAAADAVIVHDALYMTSIFALMAARRAGKPILLIQHIAEVSFSSALLRGAMRLANRIVTNTMLCAADQVLFISATTREAFHRLTTRRAPLTLFNGVDGEIFNTSPNADRATTRRMFGLPDDRRLILFVGRFVEKKGLMVIAALARHRPDLHVALAGRGSIDPDRWKLPNVTVVRGVSGRRLAALYCAADLLLLPSVGEGYPLVIQEAMACGLRVICGSESARADPNASRWLIGINVVLARPEETAAAAASAIDAFDLTKGPDMDMARYAAEAYSWERMASQIVEVLAELPG